MTGVEAPRFDPVEEFSIGTAIEICEIYRNGSDWKFNAVGAGYTGGLDALCFAVMLLDSVTKHVTTNALFSVDKLSPLDPP